MKPSFALILSYDGIALLHRNRGGWLLVGDVALDDPDLAERLAWLRKTAAGLSSGGVTTKLVLPNEEILYSEVEAPGPSDAEREAQVRAGLVGRTPYAVDDLCYDYVVVDDIARVAVVARETLAEAESFATEHRFNPVAFCAIPPEDLAAGWFPGEPLFGTTRAAESLLDPEDPLERDDDAIRVIGAVPGLGGDGPVVQVEDSQPAATETVPEIAAERAVESGLDDAPENIADATPKTAPEDAAEGLREAAAERGVEEDPKITPETAPVTPDDTVDPAIRAILAAEAMEDSVEEAPDKAVEAAPVAPKEAEDTDPPLFKPNDATGAAPPPEAEAMPSLFASRRASPEDKPVDPVALGRRIGGRESRLGLFATGTDAAGTAPRPLKPVRSPASPDLVASRDLPTPPKVPQRPKAPQRADSLEDDLAPARLAAAQTLFAEPPKAPPKLSLGLVLTGGLLAVLLLAALLWVVLGSDETAQDAVQDPEPAALVQPDDQSQAPLPETAEITAEPDVPADVAEAPDLPGVDDAVFDAAELEAEPEADLVPPMLSLLDAEAAYATTGIWQRAPDPLARLARRDLDGLYLTSLDPEIAFEDAVALPQYATGRDFRPPTPLPPVAPGQEFVFDDAGLVVVPAGPDGALTPDGVRVRVGATGLRPLSRPAEAAEALAALADAEAETRADTETIARAAQPPRARPTNATELIERAVLGGFTRAELAARKPAPRPVSEQALAAAAALAERGEAAANASPLAVASSRSPSGRPSNIAAIVERARAATPAPGSDGETDEGEPEVTTVAARAAPNIPSTASVARQATIRNAISLRRVNLIGVYGTPSDRRALVRLSSGRIVRVQVGDSLDGGRVAAISNDAIQYVKNGQNIALGLPDGY